MSKSSLVRPLPTAAIARVLRAALLVVAIGMPVAGARADELQDVSKLVSAGRLIEAENRADAYLAKTPKDAQMRFLKGVILSQKNQRGDAIVVFTALTQDFPELPEPYNNLAVIYAAEGEYDKARDALELAVRVSPRYATAHENLGDVYAALAARSYQDARRYDGSNAAALRKLNAERALLTGSVIAAPVTPTPPAAAPPPATTPPAAEVARSQRNVGLPQPAAPAATTVGFGADAPEIVLPSSETAMPRANVVGYEASPSRTAAMETSTLPGVTTQVAGDPAATSPQAIADVTTAVQRWAAERSLRTDGLHIRVDGDTAVARFPETLLATGKASASNRAPTRVLTHVLTLRSNGAAWTVTAALTES